MTWMPIETAPKDGTDILLWWVITTGFCVVGCYREGQWVNDTYSKAGDPTHWMPLPDPPKEAT